MKKKNARKEKRKRKSKRKKRNDFGKRRTRGRRFKRVFVTFVHMIMYSLSHLEIVS